MPETEIDGKLSRHVCGGPSGEKEILDILKTGVPACGRLNSIGNFYPAFGVQRLIIQMTETIPGVSSAYLFL